MLVLTEILVLYAVPKTYNYTSWRVNQPPSMVVSEKTMNNRHSELCPSSGVHSCPHAFTLLRQGVKYILSIIVNSLKRAGLDLTSLVLFT